MSIQRGIIPDLTEHAIERMLTGFAPTSAELAAYQIWSDGVSSERPPMTVQQKRLIVQIVSQSSICTLDSLEAAKKYAHARAHNAVKG